MANITQVEVNGTTYDICDATARDSITQLQETTAYESSLYTIECSTGNTISHQNCQYKKIGRLVVVEFMIWASSSSSTDIAYWTLPFTPQQNRIYGHVGYIENSENLPNLHLCFAQQFWNGKPCVSLEYGALDYVNNLKGNQVGTWQGSIIYTTDE